MRIASVVFLLLAILVGVRLALRGPSESENVVAIPPATEGDVTLLFFGDSGSGTPVQEKVAEAMVAVCRRLSCDAGLVLGDSVYHDGPLRDDRDPWLDQVMGSPYAGLASLPGFQLHAVAGNHDLRAGLGAIRAWTERNPLWSMPEPSFAVPRLPDWIHVFGIFTPSVFELDDEVASSDPLGDPVAPVAAAERFFCGPERFGWKILFGHHPLFSTSHGTARRLAPRLLPVIARCGVDVYLAGHAHQQEHIHGEGIDILIQGAAVVVSQRRAGLRRGARFAIGASRELLRRRGRADLLLAEDALTRGTR